jgi:hypothetical protein
MDVERDVETLQQGELQDMVAEIVDAAVLNARACYAQRLDFGRLGLCGEVMKPLTARYKIQRTCQRRQQSNDCSAAQRRAEGNIDFFE